MTDNQTVDEKIQIKQIKQDDCKRKFLMRIKIKRMIYLEEFVLPKICL